MPERACLPGGRWPVCTSPAQAAAVRGAALSCPEGARAGGCHRTRQRPCEREAAPWAVLPPSRLQAEAGARGAPGDCGKRTAQESPLEGKAVEGPGRLWEGRAQGPELGAS